MSELLRTPWPDDFPDVLVHTDLKNTKNHKFYWTAKSGNDMSAYEVSLDNINPYKVDNIKELLPNSKVLLCPVTAKETQGHNAIPDAMARILSEWLQLERTTGNIIQINLVGHTGAPGFRRFVTPALFDGTIKKGYDYILIDDHIGLGGTLANLKGFIEHNGSRVIGITTLTETRDARKIALCTKTLNALYSKHGEELNGYWKKHFGFELNCLTELEGQLLLREQTFEHIREKLAKAASETRGLGLSTFYEE